MISLRLTPGSEKFRAEFLLWLKSNRPPSISIHDGLDRFVELSRIWQRKLAEACWIGVHWPVEFGGRGMSLLEEAIGQELLGEAGSPQLINLFGLTMAGPVLLKHGTVEQKSRFLKKILLAEEIWCQGFSEPEAGSDLAALKTVALRDAADPKAWRITGQKVWTGFAQYADWCFMLVRTDSGVPRHKGLSYFLVPMKQDSIRVRPLEQITGESEFNEVFLDSVAVSDDLLVGGPGKGWEIALTTLMYERAILTFGRFLQSEKLLEQIRVKLSKCPDAVAERRVFGELVARSIGARALALSHLAEYSTGKAPGPEGSLDKLGWSELFQKICQFGVDILGSRGAITSGDFAENDGLFPFQYLYCRGRTIAAGTSEVQRNIIAERVLGLPRE